MTKCEKSLLQALQEIVAACSNEAIEEVEQTHSLSSGEAYAYTVGKVSSIAERTIRDVEAAAAYKRGMATGRRTARELKEN